MLRTLTQRSTIVALIVGTITGLALCVTPLLGAPGIESALVLSLILPPFCGALGARVVDRLRKSEGPREAAELIADAVAGALAVLAVPVIILGLDTLRVPVCAPLEGYGFLLMGPTFSVVLAASVGAAIATVVSRPRWATLFAVLAPFVGIGVALYDFHATPAIFSYGHFFGYFPGTLYDPDITLTPTYASFRVATMAWILGIWAAIGASWHPERKRVSVAMIARRWRLAMAGAISTAFAIALAIFGNQLGHHSTSASIAEKLGGRLRGERCTIVYPREMPRRVAGRLLADCDFRIDQAARVLGVHQPAPITAFFFRSGDEKRQLMGASATYIAKPWRNEVYLQVEEWPHTVLFHEITHAVAGTIGRGPFRVSGHLDGIWPSPAIIEGVAVAIAWAPQDGLTPHQWARAMLEVGLAPPLEAIDGLSFLGQPASRAYTAAGSFVRWILETQGSGAIRRLYLTGDFEQALGRPLSSLERDWHRFLREHVDLPPEARALAQLRFEQPGIFGRVCPHRIANLETELSADLAAGDDRHAAHNCNAILAIDPGQTTERSTLVGALARLGRTPDAERELRTLIGPPSAAPPVIFAARRGLADAYWMRGESPRAAEIYRSLLTMPMTDEEMRQIEVRLLATQMGGEGELALRGLQVPAHDETEDPAVTISYIAALERVRAQDGLAAYLEARQLMFRQRYELALPRIITARAHGLPTRRIQIEARRMEAIVRFGSGDVAGSRQLWRRILYDRTSSTGARVEAQDWLTRIRRSTR